MIGAVLVLGASGAIGRAVVAAAVAAGRPIIAVARGGGALKALQAAHPQADLTLLRASVATERGGARLVAQLRKLGRPLDAVVVALKGTQPRGRVLDANVDAFRAIVDTDLAPHLIAARHLLPWLAATDTPTRYVVIGGPGSATPWAGYGHRSIAAAALRMLLRVLHDEARASGVRVQLLDVATPACTDANAAHACPQWPSANAIGARAFALATAPRDARTDPVVAFQPMPRRATRPTRDADIADARAFLQSLTASFPAQDSTS